MELHESFCRTWLFVVCTEKVDVDISGPGKVDVRRKEMKGANMYVDYVPLCPGEYDVAVRVDGRNVHGSPFPVKISGTALVCRDRE